MPRGLAWCPRAKPRWHGALHGALPRAKPRCHGALLGAREPSPLLQNHRTSKTLKPKQVDRSLLLRDGIGKLLKKTEELQLSNLEEVCRGPIPLRSLDNLKILDVEKCHGLKFPFLLSTARGLSQLEEMTINDCNAMQQIIACGGEFEIKEVDHVGTDLQLLPKLRFLKTTSQETCSQGNPDIHMPFCNYQVCLSLIKG